jgi:BclB C-terminal domain-containing protein
LNPGGTISLLSLDTQAFSMPRNGVITSIAAYASILVTLSLPVSTATITAELYRSTAPNDDFSPVPGTLVTLTPSLTGTVNVGTTLRGLLTGLNIAVSAETRLMLVFTVDITAGLPLATVITAHVGGGVAIS